jgi:hypothetical protein
MHSFLIEMKNFTENLKKIQGVRGQVVKVVEFKLLAAHRCGFVSRQRLWILSCEKAIQLAYGTSAVLIRCPFLPEITHEGAPEVFLHE